MRFRADHETLGYQGVRMRRVRELVNEIIAALGLSPAQGLAIVFVIILIVLIYIGFQMDTDSRPPPCAAAGTIGRCYHVTQRVCEITLEGAEKECREFVKGMNLPLGRPLGATLFQCELATFDKSFLYSRKSTPECNDMFREVEGWKRANGI